MKLSNFKCLMGKLAMTVGQRQLDELKAISNLSEWEKGEARSCIKLLLLLRRKLATDMDLVEALLQICEGIPTMTNLYNIVKQFKEENPSHLEEEKASNNGVMSSLPSLSQKDTFRRILLRISQSLSWTNLEIMIALSPTPEGSKERITMGIHLFEEMKTYGCISENDIELLQCMFTLLNLKTPMDILQEYTSEFFSKPSAPPPSLPYYSYASSSHPGPPSMSPESVSTPVSGSYSHPFPNPSYQPSSYVSDRYSIPQPRGHFDDYRYPLSHRPGSLPQSSQPAKLAQAQSNPTPSHDQHSLSVPQAEVGPQEQPPQKIRAPPAETTVKGGSPKQPVQSFVWRSSSGHPSMSSLQSTNARHDPVKATSYDEGVTAYPKLNPTPSQISASSSQPSATPASQSSPTAGTHTHSAPMPGTSKPHTSASTATTTVRGLRRKESRSAEMPPPQKRPRTGEPVSVSQYQPISQAVGGLQGSIDHEHSNGGPFGINTNTGWSTTSSTYSATSGIERHFFTPHTEQGQLPQTSPGQSLQSELSSVASYPAHPNFPNPVENVPHLPAPSASSSPPLQYVGTPRTVQRSPNVLPTTRAYQLSTAATAHSLSRPRQAAAPQMSESGNIISSPVSDDRNVDLQNPTGDQFHRAEAYSSMSSRGEPSLGPTESTLASYQAGSLSFTHPEQRNQTGEMPVFVPGTNAAGDQFHRAEAYSSMSSRGEPSLAPTESTLASYQARSLSFTHPEQRNQTGEMPVFVPGTNAAGNQFHRAEAYSSMSSRGEPSLAPTESTLASYQARSLSFTHPEQRNQTGEMPVFVPGTNAAQAAGSEEESINMPAATIRGGVSHLYPTLPPGETDPVGNNDHLSEASSFTTVTSSNETEESSETSARKRPRTRSQKGSKDDDEQSSTSKRQKTTTVTKHKSKVSSKNIKSSKSSEKVKVKLEKPSLSSKFLSYLWPFGSKASASAETEERQSGEDNPEHSTENEEAQTSDTEYESAKEEEPNSS